MDATFFDRLARAAGGRSRRSALKTAFGVAAVAAVGLLTPAGSAAKKKRKKCRRCRGKAQGERCLTNKECCANETRLACALTNAAGLPVCCGVLGAPCGVDGNCCRGFSCSNSECVVQI